MEEAFLCDAIRTPFGRYGGALACVRTDDLGAIPLRRCIERNPRVDWGAVDDVVYGCANQAGEDNRNVARMALLLAGLPQEVPGTTVNRLCGSSLDAIAIAARAIKCGETALMIAGGVESMTRAPFVMAKADSAFSRAAKVEDTTIGWRFVNPLMKAPIRHRLDARDCRERRDRFRREPRRPGRVRAAQPAARRRRDRRGAARRRDRAGDDPAKKGDPVVFTQDEHPRATTRRRSRS